MTRYQATLAYDGTAYHGYQVQANATPTIQGTVEAALTQIRGDMVRITGAGRTDAGVHATGQVIAFDLDWQHPVEDLNNALNANLPRDIAVWDMRPAPADFHPRYDARRRTYVYAIYCAPVRHPLRERQAWHIRKPLDVAAMQEAMATLPGERDYSTFGSPPQGVNAVRVIYEARWDVESVNEDHTEHRFTITGNAFLYRMVRSIVGTLVAVGLGQMTAPGFRAILEACDRSQAEATAPPQGLTLVNVEY